MTIKEVEKETGLARSNIRFYEKENLIQPDRNSNGYREYSEENVQDIKKIAYLRTLGISIECIRRIINSELSLKEAIIKQDKILDEQIIDLKRAKSICKVMIENNDMNYDTLNVEDYVPKLTEHWDANKKVFRLDSVTFLYLWGGILTWGVIAVISLLLAGLIYPHLPTQIPVQWSNGEISSEVNKAYIFAYPAACIILRFLLRPYIDNWLKVKFGCSDAVCDYIINYLCFVSLSVEIFTIFFVYGIAKHIVLVLLVDTIVLIGILLKKENAK